MQQREIAEQFAREVAEHRMSVLRDEGGYRHLRFARPGWGSHSAWDLITVPGTLLIKGDYGDYVLRPWKVDTDQDAFDYIRQSRLGGLPDIDAWADKVTSGRDTIYRYDQQLLVEYVQAAVQEALERDQDGRLAGLAEAVEWHILEELTGQEQVDHHLVETFRYWADPEDEADEVEPDFCVPTYNRARFRQYDHGFVWCCLAIAWGVDTYDRAAEVCPDCDDEGGCGDGCCSCPTCGAYARQ